MIPRVQKISRSKFPLRREPYKQWNGDIFRFFCYSKTDLKENIRFAVVISKKQYATIVERNLIKRRFFSAVSQYFPFFDDTPFGRCVAYPKREIAELTQKMINEEIMKLSRFCFQEKK